MRTVRIASVLAGLALAAAVPAAAEPVQAVVSRTEVTVEDQIVLTVIVDGTTGTEPQLPDLPDFDVQYAGQSSQMQIINGRTSNSVRFNYLLLPTRTGTFTIPPIAVTLEGQVHRTQPIRVRVLEASATPQEARQLFVTAEVSDREPYVGEQVIFTWKLYRRVVLAGANLSRGDFDGFLVENLGEIREYQTTVKGQRYAVHEMRLALFPQREGSLTVPGTSVSCQVAVQDPRRRRSIFDDFFSANRTETKVLRTQPIELSVRPLPAAPQGFSGLVGSFEVAAEISKRTLAVGESATLTLTVKGEGNVQMIGELDVPELTDFKVYDDRPTSSVDRSGRKLAGSKTFHKALVPLVPGQLTLPSVPLTYFDPEAGSYRTAATPRIALTVEPGEGREELRLTESMAPTTGKVAVKILADDILPLHKGLDAVAVSRLDTAGGAALWLGGFLVPPLAFAGVFVVQRRRRRYELDAGLRRRRTALRRATRGLKEIAGGGEDGAAAAERVSRCLREYVGDKLGLPGSALTAADTDDHLRRRGVDPALARRTHELLDRLEAARYGAGAGGEETGSLAPTAQSLIKQLDRQLGA